MTFKFNFKLKFNNTLQHNYTKTNKWWDNDREKLYSHSMVTLLSLKFRMTK